MSRKLTLRTEVLSAKSLATSFISPPTIVTYLDNCSYEINITTTNSTGTFKVQGSNDYTRDLPSDTVTNAGTWTDLPLGGGTPNAAAADDSILIDLNQLPFNAIRLVYTSTVAGTGHADVWMMGKTIGS